MARDDSHSRKRGARRSFRRHSPVSRRGVRRFVGWCPVCDVPLAGGGCDICGSKAVKVSVTPPGDVRPGFDWDREMVWKTVDDLFGGGAGKALLRPGEVFLMNRAPAEDRMEEVIAGGEVLGALRYDIFRGVWTFVLREPGGRRIASSVPGPSRGVVVVDGGAVPYILGGSNVMAPGVLE
ncbi:MAG: hypothetical protein J7L61_00680, partial [Thermoplasmata archaeon]|nr:hypothetical protein [Thermoplasmata archaeon]